MSLWAPFLAWEGIEGSVDKNGLITLNISYYVPTIVQALRFVPEEVKSIGLPCVRRNFKQEWGNGRLMEMGKDGAYRITLGCEGVQDPRDGENGVQFSSDATLAEDPPEASPNFQAVYDAYHGSTEDGVVVFDQTYSPDGVSEPIKNPAYGLKKWRNPGVVWQKTYCTIAPPPGLTYMLGKIDTPPSAPDGYIPQLPGKRNWLKIVGKADWRGNIWKVTEAWEMSGDGGWIPELYR